MSENSRPRRILPAILTALALVAGCATVDSTTPKIVGTTPKEDTEAGIKRWEPQAADQRVWIENACPREIMGPGPWKRCAERNLQALQAGLPDLTVLASADRAWIENACPRQIMEPDPWKRCAERNLQALQAGLPDLTALASADRAWIENACPRQIMEPDPWKRCAERNLQALQAGLPDLTALASADRAWIENACPQQIMGPGPWKRCAERNLQALQAGLPDLTVLASADRAWIENACPRQIMGPDPWKRCAERNLQAFQAGLPDLTALASGASQDRASRVDHNDGGGSAVATRAEPRRIVEEITGPESTGHTTTNTPPDPPRLAAPVDGERWFCYTNPLSTLFDQSPEIVLTREGETDQPFGKGRVLVADVIYDAIFQIEGIDRRWDWSDGMDSISVNSGGVGAYFNFRLLEQGKTRLPPTQQLWCNQK